jgi:hypothetical protein
MQGESLRPMLPRNMRRIVGDGDLGAMRDEFEGPNADVSRPSIPSSAASRPDPNTVQYSFGVTVGSVLVLPLFVK